MEAVLSVLPESIKQLVQGMDPLDKDNLEEIRIRIHRPLEVIINGKPRYLGESRSPYIVQSTDSIYLINQLSHYSLYAFEEELKRGYITIRGGHRVGLAGKVTIEKGTVKAIRDISSYNIRIAKQKKDVAQTIVPYLHEHEWHNTLIIGPPQTGKTTLLRDLARIASSGIRDVAIEPIKVGVVDERSEIAASVKGVPQHDLGDRIDVLDGCPKAEGMMMLIRSMSPDLLVVDEIGRREDSEAIHEAINAGVKIITTIHGYELEDIWNRPSVKELIQAQVFSRYVELSRQPRLGSIVRIRGDNGKDVVRFR